MILTCANKHFFFDYLQQLLVMGSSEFSFQGLKGSSVNIIRTSPTHLADFTHWRKWEGSLDIFEEEETFANQNERIRRLKLLKEQDQQKKYFFSVIDLDNNLISLLEFYDLGSELYSPNWLLKKVKNGFQLANEAGKLMINFFFTNLTIESIFFDLPEYRSESILILGQLGFQKLSYYYKLNFRGEWQKIITLRLLKRNWMIESGY